VELGQQGLLVKTANKHYQITPKGAAKLGPDDSQPLEASLEDAGRVGYLGNDFEKETELHKALRANIEQLEEGLRIIDGGKEKIVPSGRIDITAEDKNGTTGSHRAKERGGGSECDRPDCVLSRRCRQRRGRHSRRPHRA
jgi:hypothetical protein